MAGIHVDFRLIGHDMVEMPPGIHVLLKVDVHQHFDQIVNDEDGIHHSSGAPNTAGSRQRRTRICK